MALIQSYSKIADIKLKLALIQKSKSLTSPTIFVYIRPIQNGSRRQAVWPVYHNKC